jgi:hypothetical protein
MAKYSVPDGHWEKDEPEVEHDDRLHVKGHEIEVVYTYDPDEKHGYGREMYTVTITYDDEHGTEALYAIKHRWKGNYWRDVLDLDWQDVPEPVRQKVASLLPVDGPDELESGVRLFDEGGESRWEKIHKPRVEAMSGDEMWGTSFLRDALKGAQGAAEALDEGTDAQDRAEALVADIQDFIRDIEDIEGGVPGDE